ncbi:MAG: mobile mystery protein A [Proteobacteria bacterium]|nr:mobile mystery protein A [Pseudomonadota bacterium]
MRLEQKKLIREQLDTTLKRFSELKRVNPPRKGWIRAIRDALGFSTRQLGDRFGVSKSRITRIEQDEVAGNVTLKTMIRMADSLDCVFVYGFVPRKTLEDTIKAQALHVVKKRMSRVAHTMALEDQALTEDEQKKALQTAVDELIRTQPKSLWEVDS